MKLPYPLHLVTPEMFKDFAPLRERTEEILKSLPKSVTYKEALEQVRKAQLVSKSDQS